MLCPVKSGKDFFGEARYSDQGDVATQFFVAHDFLTTEELLRLNEVFDRYEFMAVPKGANILNLMTDACLYGELSDIVRKVFETVVPSEEDCVALSSLKDEHLKSLGASFNRCSTPHFTTLHIACTPIGHPIGPHIDDAYTLFQCVLYIGSDQLEEIEMTQLLKKQALDEYSHIDDQLVVASNLHTDFPTAKNSLLSFVNNESSYHFVNSYQADRRLLVMGISFHECSD